MIKDIIVLTKSYKHGGFCVAGIDCNDGGWIRLISNDNETENAVPYDQLLLDDGTELQVFDVIRCNLIKQEGNLIQPENWFYEMVPWIKLRTSNLKEVLELHNEDRPWRIFGTRQYNLDEAHALNCGYSLCLLHIKNINIVVKGGNTKVNFIYNGEQYQFFGLSQIDLHEIYSNREDGIYNFLDDLYVVCSLTGRYEKDGKYYKMIAQVFE